MNIKRFVRQSLFLLGFPLFVTLLSSSTSYAEILPDIEAQQSKITPLQISKSGRIYRLKMESNDLPKTGNIILISDEGRPIMAFRVLKTDTASGELIAKRVRRYDAEGELKVQVKYSAVEKVADLLDPPPPESGQYNGNAKPELDPNPAKRLVTINNQKNNFDPDAKPELDPHPIKEIPEDSAVPLLGSGKNSSPSNKTIDGMDVEKFDDALDSTTSPRNVKNKRYQSIDVDPDNEIPSQMLEIKNESSSSEKNHLQPFVNSISMQAGSLKNLSNLSNNSTSNSAFMASYSHLLDRNVWIERSSIQDSLQFESGLAYYSRTDFTGNNDDYTILPLRAELQYHNQFSDTFGSFAYLGLQYNLLLSSSNVNVSAHPLEQTALDSLTGLQPTVGIGAIYNIGPQWYLRADLGWDRIAFGLSVKW